MYCTNIIVMLIREWLHLTEWNKFYAGMENTGYYTVWRTRDVTRSEMNLDSEVDII